MSSQELMKEYRKTKWEYDKTKKSENIAKPKKSLSTYVFRSRDTLEASLVVYLLSYWDFLLVLTYLVIFNCCEKTILIIIILFLLYLWAELAVGIFFQDSWVKLSKIVLEGGISSFLVFNL